MDRLRTTYGSPALAPQPWKDAFLQGSRPLMWMTNFLTFNSRAILIYATCLLDCPWVYLFMEIVVYNLIYVSMHTRHENLCAHMAACLETAAPTTARPGFCETDDDLVAHEAAFLRHPGRHRAVGRGEKKTKRGDRGPSPASHKRPEPYQTPRGGSIVR